MSDTEKQKGRWSFHGSRRLPLILGAVLLGGGLAVAGGLALRSQPKPAEAATGPRERAISALGRIQPRDGVISLAVPAGAGPQAVVTRWLVREGQPIRAGQVLAELDIRASRLEDLRVATSRLELARATLAKVAAGSDPGERQARQGDVNRLRQQRDLALSTYRRRSALAQQGALSVLDMETDRAAYESAEANLRSALGNLEVVSRVRSEDLAVAQAQVREADAQVQLARQRLEDAVVRAPVNGTLLRILTYPGMRPGGEGIGEVGETGPLQVFSQVVGADVPALRLGQGAVVTPQSGTPFGPLRARIVDIGQQVSRKDLFADSGGNDLNTRVVLVKLDVAPADRQRARRFINLDVIVRFDPRG